MITVIRCICWEYISMSEDMCLRCTAPFKKTILKLIVTGIDVDRGGASSLLLWFARMVDREQSSPFLLRSLRGSCGEQEC
jgi:hypothetical protein